MDHTLRVETIGDNVSASIDGKTGEGSNLITIKNYQEGTVGNLSIGKTVEGNGGDKNKKFDFEITFELPSGTAPDSSFPYVGEGLPGGEIKSGDIISLAHDESITITGLPGGTKYWVIESDYIVGGYITESQGETGVIAVDETVAAQFTNTRNVGFLSIAKEVAGNGGDESKKFKFTVTLDLPEWVPSGMSYPYAGIGVDGGHFKNGDTFLLAHGESITIMDLPEGTGYIVSENDYRQEGYITTTDGGETGDIFVAATKRTVFTNTREVGDLKISKLVSGRRASRKKKFEFTALSFPSGFLPTPAILCGGRWDWWFYFEQGSSPGPGESITIKDPPAGTGTRSVKGIIKARGISLHRRRWRKS